MKRPSLSPETLAAQALGDVDPVSGGLTPAITLSTSYEQNCRTAPIGRTGSTPAPTTRPTRMPRAYWPRSRPLRSCVLFASGMAAATAIFQSLLPGDHVLVSRVLYWGVRKWLAEFALTWGLDVEFVDTGDHDAVSSAIRPGRTRLLWVETPANPMWEITDLAGICELAHAAGVAGGRRQHGGDPGAHPTPRAGRRPGGPFRHQVPQRPQRRVGRCGADRPPGSLLGADPLLAA